MNLDDALRLAVADEVRKVLREELGQLRERLGSVSGAPSSELLSPKAAATLAGVNPATIRAWIAQGLPAYGKGRVLRVRRDDLLAFLSKRGSDARSAEDQAVSILSRLNTKGQVG